MFLKAVMLFAPVLAALMPCSAAPHIGTGGFKPDAMHLYVDMAMDDSTAFTPYCFRSLNEALLHLTNGTERNPMNIYIAPGVYWLDNPDDPMMRYAENGRIPSAFDITCDWLGFIGITGNCNDVVIACNRGADQGSFGGFLMMDINGEGVHAEGVTFGNFCNTDLDYDPNPALGRERRSNLAVPSGIAVCNGDRNFFRNCRFVGRTGMMPFQGGSRTLYDSCLFECGDEALNPNCVYTNCLFDLYGTVPLSEATGTGVAFLGCEFRSHVSGTQYLTHNGGQTAVVDCTFHGTATDVRWCSGSSAAQKLYQSGTVIFGERCDIMSDSIQSVVMDDLPLLDAYKISIADRGFYNVYNLLKGSDGWDPLNMAGTVAEAEEYSSRQLTGIPTVMSLTATSIDVHAEYDPTYIEVDARLMSGEHVRPDLVGWEVSDGIIPQDKIAITEYGCCLFCELTPENTDNVFVTAVTESGLEAATQLSPVMPDLITGMFTSVSSTRKKDRNRAHRAD